MLLNHHVLLLVAVDRSEMTLCGRAKGGTDIHADTSSFEVCSRQFSPNDAHHIMKGKTGSRPPVWNTWALFVGKTSLCFIQPLGAYKVKVPRGEEHGQQNRLHIYTTDRKERSIFWTRTGFENGREKEKIGQRRISTSSSWAEPPTS